MTVDGHEVYGPSRFFGLKVDPVSIRAVRSALDVEVQRKLWLECERRTWVVLPL
ncbi:hypothetical protein AB0M45_21795 [Nocardia sp. NPDC051787]|uniref:hypothetical protein n=1 Tax=Nocardia sp. NPDC051787 TaxID=3155415 RepID=UPI003449A3EF